MNGLKTIISALVAMGSVLAGQMGLDLPLADIEGLGNDLIAVIASGVAVWGRIVATKSIGGGDLS